MPALTPLDLTLHKLPFGLVLLGGDGGVFWVGRDVVHLMRTSKRVWYPAGCETHAAGGFLDMLRARGSAGRDYLVVGTSPTWEPVRVMAERFIRKHREPLYFLGYPTQRGRGLKATERFEFIRAVLNQLREAADADPTRYPQAETAALERIDLIMRGTP